MNIYDSVDTPEGRAQLEKVLQGIIQDLAKVPTSPEDMRDKYVGTLACKCGLTLTTAMALYSVFVKSTDQLSGVETLEAVLNITGPAVFMTLVDAMLNHLMATVALYAKDHLSELQYLVTQQGVAESVAVMRAEATRKRGQNDNDKPV